MPFGKKDKINCDIENMKRVSDKIQNVEFYNCDYQEFFKELNKKKVLGDAFVYFDPPYIPEEKVVNKKQELYTSKIFEHEQFIKNIDKLKINKFLISMSDSKQADLIYGDLNKYVVNDIIRTINPLKTIKSTEIVYSNYIINKRYE